jgi:hypothetical protein
MPLGALPTVIAIVAASPGSREEQGVLPIFWVSSPVPPSLLVMVVSLV